MARRRYKTLFAFSLTLVTSLVYSLGIGCLVKSFAETSGVTNTTELHVIDVYEGVPHESGIIDVHITIPNKPLALYFGAYQPVKWNLLVEPRVQIERIILSGYHPQTVAGAPPNVPILTLPYRVGYASTGISKPTSLQGGYTGRTFYIGGMPRRDLIPTGEQAKSVESRSLQSGRSGADLPLVSMLAMPFPTSHGDGPITNESIEHYKTIAVVKFSDDAGAARVGTTAAVLVTHLLTLAGFSPVERVQLDSLLNEQQLQLNHGDERTMVVNVGRLTGATAVVVGEIHKWGFVQARTEANKIVELPTVSLSLRIIDAEKGIVLFSGHGDFTSTPQTTLDAVAKKLLKALVERLELKVGLISTGSLGFSWSRQVRSGVNVFTVTEFNRPSPAHEAGLQSGDIILGCNGSSSRTWTTDWHAKRACQAEASQSVALDVRRGEQVLTISVRSRNRFEKEE